MSQPPESQWRPPKQGLAAQWWLQLILKYLIGGGGLIYELTIDKLRNPTALVVFGGIAGVTDVLGYRASVREQIKREKEQLEDDEQ